MKQVALHAMLVSLLMMTAAQAAESPRLRPFVLANEQAGSLEQVVDKVRSALKQQGLEEAGSYSPYTGATVLVVTHPALKAAAARAKYGGFGAGQRVAVTAHKGKVQVSYANPAYIGAAYGLGNLEAVSSRLKAALGAVQEFGSDEGLTAEKLAPGNYHYQTGMPYFHNVDLLATHANYQAGVAAVEKGLLAGKGGTRKVYRIDLPGQEVSVFGVAIVTGDGIDKGAKDTDKEIMDIIDWKDLRASAYLPYELMVQGNKVIALRGRYRIAVHFPDTSMIGAHGFTKIMSAPGGIKEALEAVAAGDKAR